MDMESLWNNFLTTVKESISSLSYETWFRDTKLVSLRNNVAIIVVPMPVHKKHLLENYKDIIEEKFTQLTGSIFNFEFFRLRLLYILNGKIRGMTKKDRNQKK